MLHLERYLLPPECFSCKEPIPASEGDPLICDLCRARWRPLAYPQCGTCGDPLLSRLDCRVCNQWPSGLGPVRSAVLLDPQVRTLIHSLKYLGWARLAESFSRSMTPLLCQLPAKAVLVPIPLASRRHRKRGYNQAEELARAIAGLTGLPVLPELLRRTRETPSQTRLGREWRRANLSHAFEARSTSYPVILVDDVFTTGATMIAAAEALLNADTPQVAGLTFARTEPPLIALGRSLA